MRRNLIFFVILALIAIAMEVTLSAAGYIVVLKGGEKISCKEPMRIQGNQAILTLNTGTLTSYPLTYVDVVETERYNKQGYGSAEELEELAIAGTVVPTPTPRMALGTVASIDSMTATLRSVVEPTVTPTPGIKLQDFPFADERVNDAFRKIFDDRGLYLYRTSTGTKPGYLFVQAVTDNQNEVFTSLRVVAEAYAVIYELDSEVAPLAVELEMVATSGKPAGTFRLTPDTAASIADGSMTIPAFYVKHVIF